MVVGPIPETVAGHPVTGLLGADFLSPYDLDLDIPAGRLTLYSVAGCAGRFLPWTGPYAALPAWRPVRNVMTLAMQVGGKTLQAELDSGRLVLPRRSTKMRRAPVAGSACSGAARAARQAARQGG